MVQTCQRSADGFCTTLLLTKGHVLRRLQMDCDHFNVRFSRSHITTFHTKAAAPSFNMQAFFLKDIIKNSEIFFFFYTQKLVNHIIYSTQFIFIPTSINGKRNRGKKIT